MKLQLFKWEPFQITALDSTLWLQKGFWWTWCVCRCISLATIHPASEWVPKLGGLNLVKFSAYPLLLGGRCSYRPQSLEPDISFSFMPLFSPFLILSFDIHSSSMTWIRLYQTVAICFQLKYFLGSLQRFICIHCLLQHHKLYWNRATWNKYLLPHSVFGLGSGI